jgi:4'-phosphopantetheinyl transferase
MHRRHGRDTLRRIRHACDDAMHTPVPANANVLPGAARLRGAFVAAWRAGCDAVAGDDAWGLAGTHHVLALLFELEDWRPWLEDAHALLDEPELERVRRKHRVRDREELSLAYGLHRLVLGCVLGQDPARVALRRSPLGQPCLPGDTVQTSLSHVEGAVAIAVSRSGCVGIDFEPVARAAQMAEIAGRVAHASEAEALAGLEPSQRLDALLALWVRKEALLKAAGIGLAREMDSFAAPIGVPVALPAADGGDGAAAVIQMLDAGPDWVAAVAGMPTATTRTLWLRPQVR